MTINWAQFSAITSQIFETIVLAVLMFVGNRWSPPLGGLFHMLFSFTLTVPSLRRLSTFLLQHPINLNAIIKPLAWLISSSGLLIGLGIHNIFWGTPNHIIEFWTILVIALIAVMEIVNDLISFDLEYVYFDDVYPPMKTTSIAFIKKYMDLLAHQGNKKVFRRLARLLYVDQTLPQLFRLLISIGMIYFSLGHLRIFSITGSGPLDIWESLLLSFSLIDITGEVSSPFSGELWNVVRLVSSFLAFFWLVMFVSLSSGSVDDAVNEVEIVKEEDPQTKVQRIFEQTWETTQKSNQDQEQTKSVRISKALIDPSQADAGNETVTLINTTSNDINLQGWKLEDTNRSQYKLPDMNIKAGTERSFSLPAYSIQLANTGGTIRLINQEGIEIDQVNYQKSQIGQDGNVVWINSWNSTEYVN